MLRDEESRPERDLHQVKRAYKKPEVVDYGNVRDITQFGAGSVMDATIGMRMA
jgi:hypothetical protein